MKKFLALFLSLTLLLALTACKAAEAASGAQQEQRTVTAPTDDATFVYQPEDPTVTPAGGETITHGGRKRRKARHLPRRRSGNGAVPHSGKLPRCPLPFVRR